MNGSASERIMIMNTQGANSKWGSERINEQEDKKSQTKVNEHDSGERRKVVTEKERDSEKRRKRNGRAGEEEDNNEEIWQRVGRRCQKWKDWFELLTFFIIRNSCIILMKNIKRFKAVIYEIIFALGSGLCMAIWAGLKWFTLPFVLRMYLTATVEPFSLHKKSYHY